MSEVSNLQALAFILGRRIDSLPVTYLELPLGAKFKSSLVWQPVVERIRRKLDFWKGPLISKGGRLTMIKSSLVNIQNYFFSIHYPCFDRQCD